MDRTVTMRWSGRPARLAIMVLALALVAPRSGETHATTPNAFFDGFETVGPLQGDRSTDPWEIKSGSWLVTDQSGVDTLANTGTNHILVQASKADSPNDPIAFARARDFRELTVQVTAAFFDPPPQLLGDPIPNSSLGIVFRAPITDDIADKDNLYLFSAIVSGIGPGFPTGKALVLFKRVGRSYFMLSNKAVATWTDFTQPHDYKVVMGGGRILAFFDGRQVIDHTDLGLGDEPTDQDQFPGLFYESGAVGLRTSSARAWFDNFSVIGTNAYEGRAAAFDAFAEYGNNSPNVRRGLSGQTSALLRRLGLPSLDTGFVYHDHDGFDDAAVRSVDNPSGGEPSVGANVRTTASGDTVTSTVRLSGVAASLSDPNHKVSVVLSAQSIDTTGTASCTGTTSSVRFLGASVTVVIASPDPRTPDTVIGPFPIDVSYKPNTVLFGGTAAPVEIVAHATSTMTSPHRVQVSALKIRVFEGRSPNPGGTTVPNPPGGKIQELPPPGTPVEIHVATATAGRYCA